MGVLLLQSGCHKDEANSGERDVQLGKLSSTWKLTSATKDDAAQDGYTDFMLALSGTSGSSAYTYSATGRPQNSPWPSSGTWTFGSTVSSQIIRDKSTVDELPMTYTVTDTQLSLDFHFTGNGYAGSRVNSAEGHWIFTFSKQ